MEGVMIEERFNSWVQTHSRNGYEPLEWEFKRGPMVENYETIYNPWGDSGYTVDKRQRLTTTMLRRWDGRPVLLLRTAQGMSSHPPRRQTEAEQDAQERAVSYTHLTLPTILRV